MIRFLIPVAVFFTFVPVSPAQEPTFRDDLRFAEALRNRGDNDLALEYLQQLAKGATPELRKELPLEFAKTRLRVAADQKESAKRLAQYREARTEFETFIRENPGHPRLAEANIDIARVLNFTGKTELSQAILADEAKTKKELANQARTTLVQAATKLAAAGKELQTAATRLPDPDGIKDVKEKRAAEAAKLQAETEVQQTELDRALNLYDQAACYTLVGNDEGASNLLIEAKKLLEPIASGSPRQPMTWKARAWLGRIVYETETTDKAHARFQDVIYADKVPAAAEGIRLAKYFRLKVIQEKPRKEDEKGGFPAILASARNWRRTYGRYLNTPEGHGMTFLLAETLLRDAATNKKLTTKAKEDYLKEARDRLRELEGSENEYTDRARRMKIGIMGDMGIFKIPIAKLTKFEDLYVRSQYEALQLAKETTDEARKARVASIMQALEKAMATDEAKKLNNSLELNNARSMYTYWALNQGKPAEAIKVGEKFARDNPSSSQAEMAAVYALQGYGQVVAKRKDEEDGASWRARMFSLAGYMEDRWPITIAGDIARHSIGLQLLREANYSEAIKKLSLVRPSYTSYPLVCFQISDACSKAEKDDIPPILGDQKGDYKKRAIQALSRMPDSALGSDPLTNQLLISGRAMIGRDLFRYKRFQQMDELANTYLGRIDKLNFSDDEEKNRGTRNQLRFELMDVKLFASYGLAEAAYQAGDYKTVLATLDPLVAAAAAPGESQEKTNLQKNPTLGTGLLIVALKANIQLGNADGTDKVLGAIEAVAGEEGAGVTNILKLLAALIREQVEGIRKKGDKAALATAIDGYVKILNKRTAKAKPSPELARAIAICYSSMDKHAEAAAALEKLPAPKAAVGSPEELAYRGVQLSLIKELRLSKTKPNLAKARKLMDVLLADPKGWARRDLLALMENGHLLDAEEKYTEAFAQWKGLVKRLERQINNSPAVKAKFLDCYFHQAVSYYRFGMTKPGKEDREKSTAEAASQLATLAGSYGDDFGNEAVLKEANDLFAAEPPLKAAFEAVRKKK